MMYVWVYLQDETPDDTLIVVLKEPKTVTNISFNVKSLVETIRGCTWSGNI